MNTPNIPRELVGTAQAVGIGIGESLDTAVPHAARCKCYEAGYVEMCDETTDLDDPAPLLGAHRARVETGLAVAMAVSGLAAMTTVTAHVLGRWWTC